MTIDSLYVKFRNLKNNSLGKFRKKKIDKDITIISNNCWGGLVYQYFDLQYQSPTIGLFFCPNDYLKFCNNLKYYVNQELKQVLVEDSHNSNFLKEHIKMGDYKENIIIGKLDDVEIVFLHYNSFQEAKKKWDRRCERINYNHILFKFNNNNGFKKEDFEKWNALLLKNKVFISDLPEYNDKVNTFFVNRSLPNNNGVNDTTYYDRDINLISLITSIK